MVANTYSDSFWGGDLSSTYGSEALVKRNQDGKKMCQELEEYLKKRAKLEYEFSKSLSALAKCFKYKERIGNLEIATNSFKQELDSIANSHHGVGVFFTKEAETVKAFREDQVSKRKQAEENLLKAQSSKLNQLSRTSQLEKSYLKKSMERDVAENNYKELERDNSLSKEIEKAKSRLLKMEEEAQKADSAYKSGVIMLKSLPTEWEQTMEVSCQTIQDLDEKRVAFLRQELWTLVNVDSKLALDIDNCCESVRQHLEKCEIADDIQAFISSFGTGMTRPQHFSFRNYKSLRDNDSDTSSTSSTEVGDEGKAVSKTGTLPRQKTPKGSTVFTKLKNPLKS